MKSYCDTYWKDLQCFDDKSIFNRLTGNQNDETPAKLYKKESTQRKKEKKETGDKDQNLGKQPAQTRPATRRKWNR
jgi:hypothetical protein